MEPFTLERPALKHKQQVLDYIKEHQNAGETEIHGGSLLEKMEYEDWLDMTEKNTDPATVSPDWVVTSTFFVIGKESGKLIGMAGIRHSLNDFLRNYGGHIGYGVRPSERHKGYATAILRQSLSYCRKIGLLHVMLACYSDNIGSYKTIEACGGIKEREFVHTDGKTVLVYWIDLDA